MSIHSADQIGRAINLLDRTEGRNLPAASSAIPSSTTIQKIASSFFESKSIEPEQGSWLALSDTLSNGSKSITLAQVEEASLLGLVERLDDLKFAVDTLENFEGNSSDRRLIATSITQIESDISSYIGSSVIQKSATVRVENGNITSINNSASFVDGLDLDGADAELVSLATIEISEVDFFNGFHAPDGCPICKGLAAASENDAITVVEPSTIQSDETPTTRDSSGTSKTTKGNSGTDYIDPLVKGPVWNLSANEKLSYSFYLGDSVVDYASGYPGLESASYSDDAAPLNATQQAEMRAVYSTYSNFAPFDFEEVTETSSGNVVGDLRVAYITNPAQKSGAAAFAYYPNSGVTGGDTWYVVNGVQSVDGGFTDNLTFAENTMGRRRAFHEIGHSIGLSHPHEGSQSDETLIGNGLVDDQRTTVMSYNNSVNNKIYYNNNGSLASKQTFANTPMIYDIAAVEYLYGSITDANLGDTTYTITNHQQIQSIVDSGGTDTLDISGVLHKSIVDLTPGSLSDIGYATEAEQEAYWATQGFTLSAVQSSISSYDLFTAEDNFGIAFSAIIENVIGSAGDDTITGNTANNQITGGAGDDTINGGDGDDTIVFSGLKADYTISGTGTITVADGTSGRDGTDTITNAEFLKFSDVTYSVSSGMATGNSGGGVVNTATGSATFTEVLTTGSGMIKTDSNTATGSATFTEVVVAGSDKVSSGGSYLRAAAGNLSGPHGMGSMAGMLALFGNTASSAISSASDSVSQMRTSLSSIQQNVANAQSNSLAASRSSNNTRELIASLQANANQSQSAHSAINAEYVNRLLAT
ncbi:zinc-dependent metalloprotease [Litorivicinus sp.]|nr:zinc-dependent metalloprotease [Litorivicinus sp.]MDC1209020.1 zinc-dependent metalloprotease [Litorivicinus sp.]MDC1466774.1 zinc-dependent metalloprotease [Litorivicinus sp.]